MKKISVLLVLLLGLIFLGGCSLYGGTSIKNSEPVSIQGTDVVNIKNFSFNPEILKVKKGATVTWTNNDPAQHQIKSATFNSGQLSKGQSFSFTFNDAGTFDYLCAIHPSMVGKIIVE